MADLEGTISAENSLSGKLGTVYAKDGLSAYEIAVKNGFDGTEEEWLASLKGKDAVIDQKYSPKSPNAQSGIAVEEAVRPKQDFFALVSGENNDKILTFMGGATIGTSGDISINSGGRTSIGAATGETLNLWGDRIEIHGEIQAFRDIDFPYGNGKITNLVTPNGTDPTQAANVEFVANERRMRLIMEHTVTANEASAKTPFVCTLDSDGKALNLDAIHIEYIIPQDKSLTATTTLSCYLNGGAEVGHCLMYLSVGTGSNGSFWVEAEKMIGDRWRTLRTSLSSNPANRQVYSSYDLEKIDLINQIKISGVYFEGITFKIWGRDAI